jgi:metal-responsive CopG/Arc/MetJ family transcriptional regulator
MEPNTIRLQSEAWEQLTDEAEELGYGSRAEYIRDIIGRRAAITNENDSNTRSNTKDYEAITHRLDELEAEVTELKRSQAASASSAQSDESQSNDPNGGDSGIDDEYEDAIESLLGSLRSSE